MTGAVIPVGQRGALIPLHEHETARLMRAATGGRTLDLAFGTSGVALRAERSPWAIPFLAEWRGLTFTDGAGI